MPDHEHADSPMRFCKVHEVHYDESVGGHSSCETYPLTWGEVVYYLNRRKEMLDKFMAFREVMSF